MKTIAQTVLVEIDEFLVRHSMAATTLGRLAVNDGHIIHDLRRGEPVTSTRIDRIRSFMAAYRPKDGKQRPRSRPAEAAA